MRLALLLACTAAIPLSAAVTMPVIFGNHMVLQQGKTLPVWGWADPGEKVTVTLHGTTATVTTGTDRTWRVDLPAQGVSDMGLVLTITGTNTLTFQDVLVGDVWLCSGQSNMEYGVISSHTGKEDIPKAADAGLRLFHVPKLKALTPQADAQGTWEVCSPSTVPDFSAVGYYFGRDLRSIRHMPIGLIESAWGGTPAQAWTSQEGLAAAPAFSFHLESLKKRIDVSEPLRGAWPQVKATYDADLKAWKTANVEALRAWTKTAAAAKAAGQPEPTKPKPATPEPKKPIDPDGDHNTPTALYNAMIHPLIPYALTGAIWYQGEANAGAPLEYTTLFPRMISNWRGHWGQGDFPFLFVHLSTWSEAQAAPVESTGPAWVRWAQQKALDLPKTGMVSAIDINAGSDIHPADKVDVGHRLAQVARKVAYGDNVACESATYRALTVEGNALRLSFDHAEGLRVAAPPWLGTKATIPSTTAPASFAMIGETGSWEWAEARIDGQTIVLTSPKVAKPVAAAYAWASNPACNVYNGAGLPLIPFCTDTKRLLPQPAR